jgi:hypothetical protein
MQINTCPKPLAADLAQKPVEIEVQTGAFPLPTIRELACPEGVDFGQGRLPGERVGTPSRLAATRE